MKRLLVLLLFLAAGARAAPLATQCSSNSQVAKLNEIKTQGGGQEIRFIEVLIMGVNVDISNWEVDYADKNSVNSLRMGQGGGLVYDGSGNLLGSDGPGGAGTVFSYPAFVTYEITPMNPQWGEIILRDTTASGAPLPGLLDYLAYTTDPSCQAQQWLPPTGGCVSPSAACVPWDANNTDIARGTDGTGGWLPDPPNAPTSGGSNGEPSAPGQKMLLNFSFFPNSGSFCTNTPAQFALQARDTSGAIKTNYQGTVNLTTTSGVGNGAYTFTLADSGEKVISIVDPNAENITVSVADSLIPGTVSVSSVMSFHHCIGGFDAYETSTAPGAISGVIHTKIAGDSIGLDLIALNSGGTAIDSGFNADVKVELLGNLTLGTPTDANRCPTSSTLLQSSTQHISGGRSTVSLAAVADAWRDTRVRIGFPSGNPTVYSCSSNNFAIRPSVLTNVAVTDADWASAGTTRALGNLAASGGVVHQAGRYFTLRATARNSSGAVTANYSGNPSVAVLSCTAPSGCVNGTLATGTFTGSGTVSTSTASYSEAGNFDLTLEDQSFAAVDSADSTPSERTISQSPAPLAVGRFVPDHFTLHAGATPILLTFNDAACASRSFTYIGQPFGYSVAPQATIVARSSTGGITRNYRGNLWKLTASEITQSYSSTPALDTSLVGLPLVSSNSDGTGSVSANAADLLLYPRSAPELPFNSAITLALAASDASEAPVPGNGIISSTPFQFDGGGAGIAFDSGNQFLYGRLSLSNAHGTELMALPMQMETQYFNGTGFLTNAADNCTIISAQNLALANYQKNLSSGETALSLSGRFSSGKSNLTLSAPGLGNSGSVDVCVDLDSAAGTGDTSCQAPTPANRAYLQGRWSGNLYDKDPKGRATFGVYSNVNEFIYFRENY